jgi:excisionase family DNA binding protein
MSKNLPGGRLFFRPDEVASVLGISRRTVYRMIKDKRLFAIKTSPLCSRIPRENLLRLVEGEVDMIGEKLLRPADVARQLAVSRSTVYRWYWEGKLRGAIIGAHTLRISEKSVREMIDKVEEDRT